MFKIIECWQGTDEWHKARLGKLTASTFDKIVTKTGKLSASSEELVNRAVAELVMGEPQQSYQSDSMLRGQSLEVEALEFFNFTCGYKFEAVGFVEAIDAEGASKGYGCSPDGLESSGRGLELKCPEAHTHLDYLSSGKLPDKYKQQVQGALLVTGYDSWIFGSYHPNFPCLRVEVKRDEKFITAIRESLEPCVAQINKKYQDIIKIIGEQK